VYGRQTAGVDVELLLTALGQRVRDLRKRQGYSQEAFADHCGVHRTFMGTIERGESNLSFQNLVKVAEGLGITLAQLFSGLERRAGQAGPAKRS
jgi:transcriptional regulator with XRE-family HTH domain